MKRILGALILLSVAGAQPLDGQDRRPKVYKLEELRWPQIDSLDRERTMFILPTGVIEQHGPHLPVGSDTYGVLFEADQAASRVSRAHRSGTSS